VMDSADVVVVGSGDKLHRRLRLTPRLATIGRDLHLRDLSGVRPRQPRDLVEARARKRGAVMTDFTSIRYVNISDLPVASGSVYLEVSTQAASGFAVQPLTCTRRLLSSRRTARTVARRGEEEPVLR
jgi:hypothetical protein